MVVIAISGKPGSGSTSVGKLLAGRLGLDYFSPGRLFKDISRGSLREQYYYDLFKELCDSKDLVIPEMMAGDDSHGDIELWNSDFGKSKALHEVIDELQLRLAEKGGIVLDGKLSIRMIKNASVKVWLEASLAVRSKRTAARDGIDFSEAKVIVGEREEVEREEWGRIYGFDYFEQRDEADLLIDTSDMIPEMVVERIVAFLEKQ